MGLFNLRKYSLNRKLVINHKNYGLPLLVVFITELVAIYQIDNCAWEIVAVVTTVFIFGFWIIMLGINHINGLINTKFDLYELLERKHPRDGYLAHKADYILSTIENLTKKGYLEFQKEFAQQEMLNFIMDVKNSILAVSSSGEKREWGNNYSYWMDQNYKVAKNGIVKRIFIFGHEHFNNETLRNDIIDAIYSNVFITYDSGEIAESGIECYWFPIEFLENLCVELFDCPSESNHLQSNH